MSEVIKPLRRDKYNAPIGGGSEIASISTVSCASGTWTLVSIPTTKQCKSLLMKMRDHSDFKVSISALGTTYITIEGYLAIDIVKTSSQFVAYVQSSAASGTLEVMLLN